MADQDFRVKNGLVVNSTFAANSSGLYFSNNFFANSSSVNATSTKASTVSQGGGTGAAMTFNYVSQTGQPTYLWGTNNGTDLYVWNPSNFSSNNASYLGGELPSYYAVNTTVYSTFAQNTAVYSTFAQNTAIVSYAASNSTVYSTFAQNTAVYSTFAQNTAIVSYAASNTYLNNNFQTTAGLSANVATLSSNNSSYLGTVIASSYLRKDSTTTIATGYNVNSYSLSSASFTVDPTLGNYQYINSLTASITITAPTSDCAVDIMITNGTGAGLAFSDFTVQTNGTGDAYATTSGNKYLIMVRRINGISTYLIKALQ